MAKTSVGKVLKKFVLSFRSHWGLKLASLLFAILLWNYIIVVADPVRTLSFDNIQLSQLKNLDQLKSGELTVKGDISDIGNINVSLKLPRSQELTKSGISASVDLSGINHEGEFIVYIDVSVANAKATDIQFFPKTVKITVEKIAKKAIPVSCEPTGVLPQGYWSDSPVATPQTVVVSGAVSDVEKVAKAVVQVSLDGLTKDFNAACDFVLLDKDGGTVSREGLSPEPANCIVSFHVLPTKKVRIDAGHCLNGTPAKGYEVSGSPELSADTLEIAAPAEILAEINSLTLSRVDITDAKSDINATATVELPADVHAVAGNNVTVHVKIVPHMVTRKMSGLPIEFTGLNGLKPDKTYTGSVTFSCPELSVPGLKESAMHLVADAAGKGAGAQTLTITATYDDPDAGLTGIAADPPEIAVKLVSSTQ